MFMINRKIHST